ncbi:MAG: hypothetical protein IKG87_16320 [Clostridia bacterium]|jgi:hypothetical protein|nr:hypothetical protein [Clostridia bacterium]
MYRNSEYYPCPTEGKAIARVMAAEKKASRKDPGYKVIQERRKKRNKTKKQRRKANVRLKNQMMLQNRQFILNWVPEENHAL